MVRCYDIDREGIVDWITRSSVNASRGQQTMIRRQAEALVANVPSRHAAPVVRKVCGVSVNVRQPPDGF